MTSRFVVRFVQRAAMLIGIAALLGAPTPYKPAWSDGLFAKLAPVFSAAGVKHDDLEMAKFAIRFPAEASVVAERAGAQDYPFFGLVGAAKAAKGKSFKFGTFTYERCIVPASVIDEVFSGASGKIDNAAAKADTNAAMGLAADYAADYAKQTTNGAKDEINRQLEENIPYFKDIRVICRFAFETEFDAEKNFQQYVNATSRGARDSYVAFRDGDVVSGVRSLIQIGATKEVACMLVSDMVGGGLVSRTPVLGTLAKNACSGAIYGIINGVTGVIGGGVGVVEDGVDYAWEAGKAGVCKIYSLIGSGCSKTKPPNFGSQVIKAVGAFCSARGGTKAIEIGPKGLRRTPAQLGPGEQAVDAVQGYRFVCGDGSTCDQDVGKPALCALAEDREAWEAQQTARIEQQYAARLPAWKSEFTARWSPLCPDQACRSDLVWIMTNAIALVSKKHKDSPLDTVFTVTTQPFSDAERIAARQVEKRNFLALPPVWAVEYNQKWLTACRDDQCRAMVTDVRESTLFNVHKIGDSGTARYSLTTPLYVSAADQAGRAVYASRIRAGELGGQRATPGMRPSNGISPNPNLPSQPKSSPGSGPGPVLPAPGARPGRATPTPSPTPPPTLRRLPLRPAPTPSPTSTPTRQN